MQNHLSLGHRITTLVLVMLAVITLDGQGRSRAERERQREQWQRVDDIFRAMAVGPGAIVADVGAGDGFFTSRLASAVGPSGRVYAVDMDDRQLDRLRRRLSEEPHQNVTVTKGTASDPTLTLDAALIVNAYHEMTEHQAMLRAIRRALKPAGRLVLVEPIDETRRSASRSDQAREHQISPEFALHDLRTAGFRIIGLEDPFTTRERTLEWMLTATPMSAAPPHGAR